LVASAGAIVVLAAVTAAPASGGPTPDPPTDLNNVVAAAAEVDELWAARHSWAGTLAGNIVGIQPYKGRILILTSGETDRIRSRVPVDKRGFVTVARGGEEYVVGPADDRGGWTGGNHIDGLGGHQCTEGFAWRSWRPGSVGAIYGSTAEHCYGGEDPDGDPYVEPYWYNNGRYVGRVTQIGNGIDNDVAFLRAASGTSFNASIWVDLAPPGRLGGVEERTVTGAAANTLNETIAFYGRTSGGGTGTVLDLSYNGLYGRILTSSTAGRPGDSGGPVYTTYTNGTVQARGTISAITFIDYDGDGHFDPGDTVTGTIFTDATHTSAALQASIYTP
jgi:hypothetical protein